VWKGPRTSSKLVDRGGGRYRVEMIAGRRFALIGTAAVVIWYVVILVVWAFQPLTDSVPVGVDYTLATPKAVSVSVDCNTLFDSTPRDDSPLPALKVQPKDDAPLGFQRTPCAVVHGHARIIFAFDTAVFAAVVAGFIWLRIRWRRGSSVLAEMDPVLAAAPSG
jgi:hypothetical protein